MWQHQKTARLSDVIQRSFILSYKEDVGLLESTLKDEKLQPTVIRASYSDEELTYSRMTRCLMNHYNAWKLAAKEQGYSLICESDFVPCKKIGELPTFWPLENPLAWAYLYLGSPRLMAIIGDENYLRCHSATTVAYVINSEVAQILIRFFNETTSQHPMTSYWPWDTHMQWGGHGLWSRAIYV